MNPLMSSRIYVLMRVLMELLIDQIIYHWNNKSINRLIVFHMKILSNNDDFYEEKNLVTNGRTEGSLIFSYKV